MLGSGEKPGSVGPVGNVYAKYNSRNPIARRLMRGFLESVTALVQHVGPRRVLEVGCGEGHLSNHLRRNVSSITHFEACDLSLDRVIDEYRSHISFRVDSAYDLKYPTRSFDLVVCCEVLEHLADPKLALRELARVAQGFVMLSTPREPMWRLLNIVRGKYWSSLGNTPGHVQHFSSKQLVNLAKTQLRIAEIRRPIPWTIVLGASQSDATTLEQSRS